MGASNIHSLLTPAESVLALVDYQPQMAFGIESHSRLFVLNNAVALAKAAKLFKVPVVLTTVEAKTFSGAMLPEVLSIFLDQKPIDRSSMNSWEDAISRERSKKPAEKSWSSPVGGQRCVPVFPLFRPCRKGTRFTDCW